MPEGTENCMPSLISICRDIVYMPKYRLYRKSGHSSPCESITKQNKQKQDIERICTRFRRLAQISLQNGLQPLIQTGSWLLFEGRIDVPTRADNGASYLEHLRLLFAGTSRTIALDRLEAASSAAKK